MTASGTKRIFISDVHLGDAQSFAGPHPYGWFRQNVPVLGNFLNAQLDDPETPEVVILGDLFDDWVIPTNQDPLTSFGKIIQNPHNEPVIKALEGLAKRALLTYLPGNHDMPLSTPDAVTVQNFLEQVFSGIRYLPQGVYRQGKLVAEHGNLYAFFNAPDTWTHPPYFLPLGYFLSRLVAYKVARTGTSEDFHDILARFVWAYKDSRNFVKNLFYAVAADAGLKKTDPINLQGLAGYPATVGGIGSLYGRLIKNWQKQRRDLDWRLALMGDVGDLYPAAIHDYFSLFGSDQNIVIFGHTHKADLKKNYLLEKAPAVKDIHVDLPCRSIYANCGAWVDAAPFCAYVETEADAARGRHYVRIYSYPPRTLLQEAFVRL